MTIVQTTEPLRRMNVQSMADSYPLVHSNIALARCNNKWSMNFDERPHRMGRIFFTGIQCNIYDLIRLKVSIHINTENIH